MKGGHAGVSDEAVAKATGRDLNGWSQIAVRHTKLPDPDAVAMRKAFWKEALDRLGKRLGAA